MNFEKKEEKNTKKTINSIKMFLDPRYKKLKIDVQAQIFLHQNNIHANNFFYTCIKSKQTTRDCNPQDVTEGE